MNVPMLDLKAQYRCIEPDIRKAIDAVLESGAYILGPHVQSFEQAIQPWMPPARALGVSNGTDALLVALMALEIGPGDEVILPPFTFFATAAAVVRVGAKPIFVDIEDQHYTIDPELIESAITPRTKAIMVVHLYGQCADMTRIKRIADTHGIRIIEDAAQSLGAAHDGRAACTWGDLACVSFYPTKNLGACGEAGLVATTNDTLYERCRIIRNQGMEPRYEHHLMGGNFRMDAIQGAVLEVKLKQLERWNRARQQHAKTYDELLASADVVVPEVAPKNTHIYHQYTIRCRNRDQLRSHLTQQGIGSDIYYPIPLHLQPCLKHLGYCSGQFPVTEHICGEVLSLPIHSELTADQVHYVSEQIALFNQTPEHNLRPIGSK